MTLNDLSNININAGRPSPTLNNDIWQQKFNLMKVIIKPSALKSMPGKYVTPIVNKSFATDDNDTIVPLWTRYRWYINDVLKNIRKGNHDYVYYIYGISELLKYEHDRLRTYYRKSDGIFEVWLDD